MSLKLIPVSVFDGDDIYEMVRKIPENDNGFINPAYNISKEEFVKYIKSMVDESFGVDLLENRVPQSNYWLYDGDKVVGMSKLRPSLNNHLINTCGGNIGYLIRSEDRGKGYGSEILRLTIEKAKAKGLDMVMVTCNDDNIPSQKVIESNGGKLEKVKDNIRFYWIFI